MWELTSVSQNPGRTLSVTDPLEASHVQPSSKSSVCKPVSVVVPKFHLPEGKTTLSLSAHPELLASRQVTAPTLAAEDSDSEISIGCDDESVDIQTVTEESVADALRLNCCRLYPLLQKAQGYYLCDSLPKTQYILPAAVRNKLIPPELKEKLSIKAKIVTHRVFQLVPTENQESFGALIKAALNGVQAADNSPVYVALSDTKNDDLDKGVSLSLERVRQEGRLPAELNFYLKEVPEVSKGKTLALCNTDLKKSVNVYIDDRFAYLLAPTTGLLLQASGIDKRTWKPVAVYQLGEVCHEETNALLRDCPRPIIPKEPDAEEQWSSEGEYFLTPELVQEWLAAKGDTSTEICQSQDEFRSALENVFQKNQDKEGASFIVFDPRVSHMVAVRILRQRDRAVIYIHETSDPIYSGAAQAIRDIVLDATGDFFKGSHRYFISPNFTSQMDFSSCGVFTCKAIRAFEKHPELDSWLWREGERYGHSLLVGRKPQKSHFIPLAKMDARLLKNYQGDARLLTPSQLGTFVSQKKRQTLFDYLKVHQPHNAIRDGLQGNLSAIGKRYKYFVCLQEKLLGSSPPVSAEVLKDFVPDDNPLTFEEHDLVMQFFPIIDAEKINMANTWLRNHRPDVRTIGAVDWDMCCDFEDYIFSEKTPEQLDVAKLGKWLTKAMRNPYLKACCIYIKQSKNSHFRGASLQTISRKLRQSIQGSNQPLDAQPQSGKKRPVSTPSTPEDHFEKRVRLETEPERAGKPPAKLYMRRIAEALELEDLVAEIDEMTSSPQIPFDSQKLLEKQPEP